nr:MULTISPECIES: helix-turn-helix domain-containing protein [unclassified Frankia]
MRAPQLGSHPTTLHRTHLFSSSNSVLRDTSDTALDDPVRARLLAALAEPGSATTLAAQTGLTRQKVNYHRRTLEQHGFIELVEERRKGNCTERVLQATASPHRSLRWPGWLVQPARAPRGDPGRRDDLGPVRAQRGVR